MAKEMAVFKNYRNERNVKKELNNHVYYATECNIIKVRLVATDFKY